MRAYAITLHKSQGGTFDYIVYYYEKYMHNNLFTSLFQEILEVYA